MGKLMKYLLKMILASILVWTVTVMLFTDEVVFNQPESTGGDVSVGEAEDGTFTGTGEGFNGPIKVEVTVENGEIAGVEVLSHDESPDISDPAFAEVPPAIVDSNSTEVDVASGATFSSEGIIEAVNNALSGDDSSTDTTSYEDGTYTASADGHNGPLEVEVIIENGEISGVTVLEHSETEDLTDPAIEDVPVAIVENNSTDVDVASSATVTSEAIMVAVDNALESAQ